MTDGPRTELGTFLRRRRNGALRADYDLPPLGRKRTEGLRREEIAFLSGVSVTWYTWLEQGRDINPSRQVIDAIAVNLRLTEPEHDYALGLAGFTPPPRPVLAEPAPVPAHVQHLLDALDPAPAFALTPHWDIAAWNRAYEGLFPAVREAAASQRNLLQFIFTDPWVRSMLPDWEHTSRQFLAEYRSEAGGRAGGPQHVRLVGHLRAESEEFSRAWDAHEVERFASRRREFLHPSAGKLVFEQVNIVPQDAPDLHVVSYLPLPESDTRAAAARLLEN
ncbi:transcriptional regulator [Brachybacterium vulturis]|uniref:Transcriptional regulator n=1 Tax=Brachybacterium vulturis TaxID=2017484 RepID=A0A291GNX0_9MICO|nr:helix-turn-helix transcriptional regulator [Brachybacterium vulturis]ATG51726.1 transcriptional regulator [Brachybacterium vulturis]